uniref:Leucine-rich PPR motif-containing protein, mitochondrial-like n=1 Tax=Saccoglossus kowalevskii TaxID=10224 RepID=A0ABM0M6I3_SACKO|nr:PREDICTED: leucine-rich PPR motif-containing protein, mitochondrial-like [Saccoglossus kowalevskii]
MAALLRSARNLKLLRYLTVPGGQVVQRLLSALAWLPPVKCKRGVLDLDAKVSIINRLERGETASNLSTEYGVGCAVSEHALLLIRCCGSLMAELSAPERTELAHMIWDKLPELGIKRNTNHYNAMLKVYLQNNHQISLSEFLENMESSGVEPNRVTYQRIIGLYCQEGDIQGAGKVLEFMKKKDMPITDGVFNSLITGHARAGDMANAEGMLTIMRNVSLEPTVDTYTSLMCAYAEKGDIENIREVLKQLRSEDTKLSNKNLMLVLHSLVTSGHEEHVSEILSHMQFGTRYAPDAINLCLTLLTEGRDDVAMEILKTFPKIRPEVETMLAAGEEFQQGSFYIKHLVLLNRPLEDIVKQMDEMKALKLHSAPYAVALQVSLEQGNVENSYALMDIMKEHGEPIRQHYFWPLMASSHRQNDVQGMCDIVKKIVESDVRLDSGSCTMYVFPTLGGDAQHLLAELQKMGVHVDETLVASLIRWEIGNGRAENITKLVKQFGPDLVYLSLFRSDLIQAIYRDPLIMKTFTKMIKSNGVESIQGDFGSFMYHLTKNIPEGYRNTILPYLQEFLKELKNQDCYITANDFRGLRRNFDRQRLNYLTPMALDLIHPDVMNSEDTQQSDLLPIQKHHTLANVPVDVCPTVSLGYD